LCQCIRERGRVAQKKELNEGCGQEGYLRSGNKVRLRYVAAGERDNVKLGSKIDGGFVEGKKIHSKRGHLLKKKEQGGAWVRGSWYHVKHLKNNWDVLLTKKPRQGNIVGER